MRLSLCYRNTRVDGVHLVAWSCRRVVDRIYVRERTGSGRRFLLLHGLGWTGEIWRGLVPYLPADLRLIAPDLPGHGRSGAASGCDLDLWAHQMAALLRRLQAAPTEVVGSSLGAAVAIRLAVRFPDLVSRLVLLDGGFFPLASVPGLSLEALLQGGDAPPPDAFRSRDAYVAYQRATGPNWWSEEVEAAVADQVREHDGGVVRCLAPELERACLQALWRYNPMADAPHLAMEVAVAVALGPDEPETMHTFKQAAAERFAARLHRPATHLLADTDHLTMLHRPAETARIILGSRI